ncbi:MAG: AMP-dependent synthetase/ligase, partial [Janibacter sp.]|nr:AMP-dependent synthetase/ligase [Janibacter sp.]
QVAYAIAAGGGIIVPIYATNSPEECHWVLEDAGVRIAVCEDAAQIAKVRGVAHDLDALTHLLTIEPVPDEIDLAGLRARGQEVPATEREARTDAVSPDDVAVIIYTSGTTGRPKGCVLTHDNLMSCARQSVELGIVTSEDSTYLFLPLAHVYAQTQNVTAHALGSCVSYASAGPAQVMQDLAEVRPTCFPSVPRIYEKVHAAFAGAPRTDEVLARVRGAFGGRIRVAISGAAPIAGEVLEFFHAAGVPVYEGYGLSESTAFGTVNLPDATRLGTIGRPMPFGEVRVADGGELQLRGPHVFAGYWRNPEATAASFTDDGWLRTGDIGEIDADGYVRITGRIKDIIITSGGKNIAPAVFENELRQSPFVSHVVMHGDRRPYPVALITLDQDQVGPWAREEGLPDDPAALSEHPRLLERIRADVDAANAHLARVEQVKRFAVLPTDFSPETGELTVTLKLRRSVVESRYAHVLDALYATTDS